MKKGHKNDPKDNLDFRGSKQQPLFVVQRLPSWDEAMSPITIKHVEVD